MEDVLAYTLATHNLGDATSVTIMGTLDGQPALGFTDAKQIMYAYRAPVFGTITLQVCVEGYGFLSLLDDQAFPWSDEALGPLDWCTTGTSGVLT